MPKHISEFRVPMAAEPLKPLQDYRDAPTRIADAERALRALRLRHKTFIELARTFEIRPRGGSWLETCHRGKWELLGQGWDRAYHEIASKALLCPGLRKAVVSYWTGPMRGPLKTAEAMAILEWLRGVKG